MGELGEIVVSCMVPHDRVVLDESALRKFAREKLASFKVPRRILLLREEACSRQARRQ